MSDNRSRRQVTDEINNNSKMLNNNWMPSNNVSPSPVKNGNWSFFSNPNFEQSDTKLSVFSKQPEWEEYELFPDRSSNRKLTLLDEISGNISFFRIDPSPSTSSVLNNPINKYSIPSGVNSTPVLETADDNRPIGRIEDNLEANFMDISEACLFFHIDSSPSTSSVLNNPTNKYSIPPGFISIPVLETANDNRPIGRIEDNLETNFMDISGAHPFFHIDSSPSTSSVLNNPTNKYSIPAGVNSMLVSETANDNRPIGRIENNSEELKICNYCLKNGAPYYIYYTHFVREQIDGKSVITCPALKSQICNYCGATGLEAHSLSHCEQWKMEVRKRELPLHLQNKCVINEFTRTL